MAEDLARICLLESNVDRHDKDIIKIWEDVTELKICASSLPSIQSTITTMGKDIKTLGTDIQTDRVFSREQAARWGGIFLLLNGIVTAIVIYTISNI